MARKPAHMSDQMLLFDNDLLTAGVGEKQPEESKLAQIAPEPTQNKALGVDKAAAAFKQLVKKGYSADESKVLLAGFSLVMYIREEKKVLRTCQDPLLGWYLYGIFPTFTKAEQVLKEQLEFDGTIEAYAGGTITMRGKNSARLRAAGFDFYRSEGMRIKQGSKNWGTWQKYESAAARKKAWDKLMKDDMKALQG